jgi:DNA (cytosine-5)-methyltransferase 1
MSEGIGTISLTISSRGLCMKSIGLFAGVGGIELGFEKSGIETIGLAEIDPAAQQILRRHFAKSVIWDDVRKIQTLPKHDVLSAGFPCQDLSQAGQKSGIGGLKSGLVKEIFRIIEASPPKEWLVIENVSYMLRLDKGRAMQVLTTALSDLGYRWAYRTVDARSFGVPQRRQRVLMVASRRNDPRDVLFADNREPRFQNDGIQTPVGNDAFGFYWTEGLRGLGWVRNAVPTVKGGSRIGIPSPPAIWIPSKSFFGTPTIGDTERLQGFVRNHTKFEPFAGYRDSHRWHLVGNAVCVPMSKWLGSRLVTPKPMLKNLEVEKLETDEPWPTACFGNGSERFRVNVSMSPSSINYDIATFLKEDLKPLSLRAAEGFNSRMQRSSLTFPQGFAESLHLYMEGL